MVDSGPALNLSGLLSLLKVMPSYTQLVKALSGAQDEHKAVVLEAARPYLIAALHRELEVPVMLVTAQPDTARKLHEQLLAWCPPSAGLHRLSELDFLPYDSHRLSSVSYQVLERLRALSALSLHGPGESARPGYGPTKAPLVVTSALGIINKTISHADFTAVCRVLRPGMSVDPLELLRTWQRMGYEAEEVVEVPGQMSRRGGIVDVFPPDSESPVRIEFSGNQVETMRCFDPTSQRSRGPVSSLIVMPAREFLMPPWDTSGGLDLDDCDAEARERFWADLARLQEGQWFPGAEFYSPLINSGSVLDYLSGDALLVLDDPGGIELAVTRLNGEAEELRAAKVERGELPSAFPSPYLGWAELAPQIEATRRLSLDTWDSARGQAHVLSFSKPQSYGSQLERFLRAARRMVEQRQRVLIASHQADRLAELLEREEIHASTASQIEEVPPPASITLLHGSLNGGWVMDYEMTLITDAELFGWVKQPRASRRRPVPRRWLFPPLSPGEYVVHVDHGIARFNGMTRMSAHGSEQEYIVLEYAAGDKLYVPSDRVDRVSRYVGAGDQAPHLSRLRSREWQRTKKRVKESVAEIARELLELYAARELAPGFAFSPDSLWQHELEASFPYVETPDQIEAIMAVKDDMERAKPTDRLICGDVGYGKTEIALRAAFKAVMDNKQVAILVPTTVLAQQHLTTFTERLQTYPVRIEMLSRFCPPQKEREILRGLASGAVDICIGTHRLLQSDITFKDLGLVIIDEEQQFGVVQKEKLKQLRKEVDTLALSATPIPRTLHMSISGIRDMSMVETPPEERLSIKTYVGVYDPTLVRQVILREIERNGQVFFVHNRVQSIGLAARKVRDAVPEARIAIAHGQMPEEQLEKVMTDFMTGEYDVLLATTIIQLGLDMPNVNTLIVDRSDKFGLGQLYQLRGRVGRGINQAYAYFFFDEGKQLTPQAYKRLRTILEATELGSGFGIAMKDLEIRGAGNLLGVKQSGHIAALGFDLYCQLLAETVEELRAKREGEARRRVIRRTEESPSISLPLAAYIPDEYVPNLGTRLSLYQRLAGVERMEDLEDMAREFEDRFGALPEPVENLLYMVRVKLLAIEAGVGSVATQGRQIVLKPLTDGRQLEGAAPVSGGVRAGATQIRIDTRVLGNKWTATLEETLRYNALRAGVKAADTA